MNTENFNKLADLAIDFGINFKPGQKVMISSEPVHAEFVSLLAKKLYEKGAAFVHVELIFPKIAVNRSHSQKEEFLSYIPEFKKAQINQFVEEKWSLISIGGMEDPEVNKEMNQKRNAISQRANQEVSRDLMKMIGSGQISWTGLCLPTKKWAEKVTGEVGEKALEQMWKDMITIMRLDNENPIDVWKKHSSILRARCKYLDDKKIKSLHFTGPNTDLKIELSKHSCWIGGACDQVGREKGEFFPNLPSEEVFTTPDCRLTEGHVKITRPVNVLGDQVEGAWFKFSKGQVVEYGADYGKHLLDSFFEIDPRARFLGEVALVDCSSPIFKTGRIFHNILFDENAACHIALGRGIGMSFNGSEKMSKEELSTGGFNESLVHIDFMIGSENISVQGIDGNGDILKIIDQGRFVI